MTMRRTLPYLIAAVLGVGAALLAACGDSTRGGIPAADAGDLKSQLEDVRERVENGNCDELPGQLRQVDQRIDELPRDVDNRLVESLRDGAQRLQDTALQDCESNRPRTVTETVPEETPTVETTPTRDADDDHAADDDDDAADRDVHDGAAAARRASAAAGARPAARHRPRRRGRARAAVMASALIAGRYELGERLGHGGMSTVQVALDRRLERQVAVKLLAEHLADDSQFISRFRREALAAARLVHPNIVQVFDFGLDEASGRHYIVMEYIRGRSGAEILREETRLGVADTLELVDGACRGLAHAHRMGVVHRDVKPGNILRSDDGAVKLADFGIAKAMVGQTSQITQAGSVLGTAAYLAPEQATGGDVGPPADLYGLGVVSYQLLAGRLPYDANSLTELAFMQQRERPPRLDELTRDVPPALALAIDRALAIEPAKRYASAEEMRAALHDGARGIAPAGGEDTAATAMLASRRTSATRAAPEPRARRLEARPAPVPVHEPEPVAPRSYSGGAAAEPRRRGAGAIIALLLVAALIAAALAFAIGNSQGGSTSVDARPVEGSSATELVDDMTSLIDDNTR